MASVFGHGLVAYTITKIAKKKVSKTLIGLAILSAIIPDADVITFGKIPYGSMFGHRGFTHAIIFAIFWSILLTLCFGKKQKKLYILVLFFATLSHGILDACTTGGKGVGFFIPFNNERYFLPWRFIKVSPIGIEKFFSQWGLQVVLNELLYIALPCSIILIILYFYKKIKK